MMGQPHKSPSIPPKVLWPVLIVVILGIAVGALRAWELSCSDSHLWSITKGCYLNPSFVTNQPDSDENVNSAAEQVNENINVDTTEVTSQDEAVEMASAEESLDIESPIISDISVSDITSSGATITWLTNKKSTSTVEYGTGSDYEIGSLSDSDMIEEHSIVIIGLDDGQTYHFRVISNDAEGNVAISDDGSFVVKYRYAVTPIKSIAVSRANPVGIATDQEGLWLMFGAHNSSKHTLVYYDVDSNVEITSFDFYNLIEELGTGVYGVTWDGDGVWISVSGNTNKLVQVDPNTGDILKTLSNPTTLGPSDLGWDGNALWVASGTGQIYTVNPDDREPQLFLSRDWRDNGLAIRDDEVWVGNLFDNDLNIYDRNTKILKTTVKDALSNNGKICFFKGQLAVLTSAGIDFYSIEPL